MKKAITIITIIVILLLNLISVNSYADMDLENLENNEAMSLEPQETGKTEMENDDGQKVFGQVSGGTYAKGQIFKTLVNVLTVIPQSVNGILNLFIATTSNGVSDKFTIYDTVMGHYEIFSINYLNVPKSIDNDSTFMERIKWNSMKYYYILRNLSIAISLFVLIYIGIRMAISTVADDKARYKKMLINWLSSLMLIFIIHFIVIIISYLLQVGLATVNKVAESMQISEFETTLLTDASENFTANGFNVFVAAITIFILVWYEVKFFMIYMHRTMEINFLVLVSPLVTVTYSIDKTGDNKAQAFSSFLKELIMKSSLQLIHAVLYVSFIATAGVIAQSQPILAILFFAALSRAEKITRNIFTIKDDSLQKANVPFA